MGGFRDRSKLLVQRKDKRIVTMMTTICYANNPMSLKGSRKKVGVGMKRMLLSRDRGASRTTIHTWVGSISHVS